jgi:alcohol dehydrogenase
MGALVPRERHQRATGSARSAARHGASVVDYVDGRDSRLEVAESLGATVHKVDKARRKSFLSATPRRYDVVVEAS